MTRRTLARAGRDTVAPAVASVVLSTACVAVLAGLYWVGLFVAGLASVAYVYIRDGAPDYWFADPDPAFERGSIVVDGMTDKEVMRRFAIVTERKRYKQEKQEEARKREERKANARRRF